MADRIPADDVKSPPEYRQVMIVQISASLEKGTDDRGVFVKESEEVMFVDPSDFLSHFNISQDDLNAYGVAKGWYRVR